MSIAISFGHVLSREAMRNLKGGKLYTVNCTTTSGYHQASSGSCSGMTQSQCQTAANNYCASTAGCSSCSVS